MLDELIDNESASKFELHPTGKITDPTAFSTSKASQS